MSDSAPDSHSVLLATARIQQRLDALAQTCEVLNLRMREFEQVLLDQDDRLRRLQAAVVHRRRRRSSRRPAMLLLLLLLPVALGLAWIMNTRPAQQARIAASTAPAQATVLRLTARGATWLEVQTASGKLLHYGMMAPGTLSFPVQSFLRVRAGRPDLVDVQFQGKAQRLGAVDAIGWHRFALS